MKAEEARDLTKLGKKDWMPKVYEKISNAARLGNNEKIFWTISDLDLPPLNAWFTNDVHQKLIDDGYDVEIKILIGAENNKVIENVRISW